jgi:S-adenosyl methyltransferase
MNAHSDGDNGAERAGPRQGVGKDNAAVFDATRPNAARMYDYFLGGTHNLVIDRECADKTIAIMPGIVATARANRAFLQRAVQYCLSTGLRQFLDLGSGIPTAGHVHQIAHAADPTVRVAYVDVEPVAVAQTTRLLADAPTATATKADIADPAAVLTAPGVTELLDFSLPIVVIACAVLHFVPDELNPAAILAKYRDSVVPGSALIFSHGATVSTDPEGDATLHELYGRTTQPGHRRTKADIEAMLAGWDLVDPGLVDTAAWRPNTEEATGDAIAVWAAVGRLR